MKKWKPIPGYEGRYSVSSDGDVRAEFSICNRPPPPRRIKPIIHRGGYTFVGLYLNRRARHWFIHQLVMRAFVGPCPTGLEINHKNGITGDNRLCNLEYLTKSENGLHSRRVLGKNRGNSVAQAKLSETDVLRIRAMYKKGIAGLTSYDSMNGIAREYGVSTATIHRVIHRVTWMHI